VSNHEDNQDSAYLDRVNENLAQSLRRCHALVDDYRGILAANSNDPESPGEFDADEENEADDERVG
jgi:hypothetical protein